MYTRNAHKSKHSKYTIVWCVYIVSLKITKNVYTFKEYTKFCILPSRNVHNFVLLQQQQQKHTIQHQSYPALNQI